jgi:hypothetical protein
VELYLHFTRYLLGAVLDWTTLLNLPRQRIVSVLLTEVTVRSTCCNFVTMNCGPVEGNCFNRGPDVATLKWLGAGKLKDYIYIYSKIIVK